ncbi:MAG: cytochrome c peroxidase [Pseudomonadota bacterium]
MAASAAAGEPLPALAVALIRFARLTLAVALALTLAPTLAPARASAEVRGLAAQRYPADAVGSTAAVALGERVFADVRLSGDGTMSCATCHDPERRFSEARARSMGAAGALLEFNAPSLVNSGYAASFGWSAPGLATLEASIRRPLLAPAELGSDARALGTLWRDPEIRAATQRAFPGSDGLYLDTVVAALASYVRSLVDNDGPLARYLYDDEPLPDAAARGLRLFVSPRLDCSRCHRGPLLSGPIVTTSRAVPPRFYRTGVGDVDVAFRAPSLLFVAHTAPYMHDGSLERLEDVVAFYARGGGADSELQPFVLTASERADLLAFLRIL